MLNQTDSRSRSWSIAGAATLAVVVGAAVFLSRSSNPQAAFVAACDEAITARLLAPATYKRITATAYTVGTPSTYDELTGQDFAAKRELVRQDRATSPDLAAIYMADYEAFLSKPPQLARALIEYDASNAAGVPIRAFADCRARVDPDDLATFAAPFVLIEGMTQMEWARAGG